MSRSKPDQTNDFALDPAALVQLVRREMPSLVRFGVEPRGMETPITREQFEMLLQHAVAEYHAMPHAGLKHSHERLLGHLRKAFARLGADGIVAE